MSNGEIIKYGATPKESTKKGESSKFRDFLAWLLPWARDKGIRADKAADARLNREIEETEKIKAERLKIEAEARKVQVETTALMIEKELQFKRKFSELIKEEIEIGKAQNKDPEHVKENVIKEKLKELDERRDDLIKLLHLYGGEITEISNTGKNESKLKIEDNEGKNAKTPFQ